MTTLRVLSLGAGVQSTTIALMMAHGEVEPVDLTNNDDLMGNLFMAECQGMCGL